MDKEEFLYMSFCDTRVHRSYRINKINKEMCLQYQGRKQNKRTKIYVK
jgi:hypothetical protein